MEAYAFNPYHIVRAGYSRFEAVVKRHVNARFATLEHLFDHLKGLNLFNLSRVVGQTGPLTDFRSSRAVLRYAGLNLRERQSGTYRGQTRLSKKGRPLLRKILGQTIFPVLRRRFLYGPYYHRKRDEGMIGSKAQVAVMRKFLCMLHSLACSGDAFHPERFSTCESQYAQTA